MAQVESETQNLPFDVSEGTSFKCLDCGKEAVLVDGCGTQEKDSEVEGFICVPCCEKFEERMKQLGPVESKPLTASSGTLWSEKFIRYITSELKRGLNRGVVDACLRKNKYPLTTRESWESLRAAYRELCMGREVNA